MTIWKEVQKGKRQNFCLEANRRSCAAEMKSSLCAIPEHEPIDEFQDEFARKVDAKLKRDLELLHKLVELHYVRKIERSRQRRSVSVPEDHTGKMEHSLTTAGVEWIAQPMLQNKRAQPLKVENIVFLWQALYLSFNRANNKKFEACENEKCRWGLNVEQANRNLANALEKLHGV